MKTLLETACCRQTGRGNISANACYPEAGSPEHTANKILLFVLVLSFIFSTAQAQVSNSRRKENFDVQKFRETGIVMPAPATIQLLHNINGITVIDARADTASIGLMQKKVIDPFLGALNNAERNQAEQRINKSPTFIILKSGLQNEAAQFVAGSLAFTHSNTLPGILMVINKLWLSDELNLAGRPDDNTRLEGTDYRDTWTSGIDVKIEFYLHDKEHYYPLYRYDSVISKAVTVSEYAPAYVALALRLALKKMPQMDAKIASITKRKQFSLQEIKRHNADAFNMPVLQDAVLTRGVYMSFEEFTNNKPSQTDYELKKDKLTDMVYIKQAGGAEYAARHVWGYCDGVHAYIRSANNFFLLQRSGNAFYIFGAKHIKRNEAKTNSSASYYSNSGGAAMPVTYSNSKTFAQLEPFQLDWSTGKLY